MVLKSILVCLRPGVYVASLLDCAVDLARRHNAHLTGLQVGTHAREKGSHKPASDIPAHEQAFQDRAVREGISHEWHRVPGGSDRAVTQEARCHDLLIVGQPDPSLERQWRSRAVLENILLNSGRPLLFIPHEGSFVSVGHRVLIAWDGTREAARAVEDAMPVLAMAQEVIALVVDLRGGKALSVEHLVALLERHGVITTTQGARSEGRPIGDVLLAKAKELNCDLLVMGGYGHRRFWEHLFGGPTYDVLRHLNVPVLMSH